MLNRSVNTVSNAAYPLASFAVLHDPFLVCALWVLGLGSGWYHWRKGTWSQRADHFGMFLVVVALAIPPLTVYAYLFAAAICSWVAFRGAHSATDIVTVVGCVAVVTQPTLTKALLGIGIFALYWFTWQKDPHDWWSEHGRPIHWITHGISAIGFVVLS